MNAVSENALIMPGNLRFATPPPGLEPAVDFTLAPIPNAVGLFSLTSADGSIRLFVLDAATHLPDYSPHQADADLNQIGTTDATVLVVVTPSAHSTVNLAAPILLNASTGSALQVILESSAWPLRAPLAPASTAA
ncbi:hypothetical protein GCM10025779_33200 [Arthrobacter cryoconiti]